MVYIAIITLEIAIYLSCQAQIALLKASKAFITVPKKYLDHANVFSEKLATMLLEHTKINTHAINIKEGKQPLYGLIYSLGPVELETLKIYIKTNLANSFSRASKFSTGAPILFNQKPNRRLYLCVNYQDLNNLTIKN